MHHFNLFFFFSQQFHFLALWLLSSYKILTLNLSGSNSCLLGCQFSAGYCQRRSHTCIEWCDCKSIVSVAGKRVNCPSILRVYLGSTPTLIFLQQLVRFSLLSLNSLPHYTHFLWKISSVLVSLGRTKGTGSSFLPTSRQDKFCTHIACRHHRSCRWVYLRCLWCGQTFLHPLTIPCSLSSQAHFLENRYQFNKSLTTYFLAADQGKGEQSPKE